METTTLFSPLALGAIPLASRIIMAPMTRNRAAADGVPTPLMAAYYTQRASAGLIITEMTHVEPRGLAAINMPGLHTRAQRDGWQRVVDSVHRAGGRIVAQLGHAGRASHPLLQPGHALPVGPSALLPAGSAFTTQGPKPFVVPRALAAHELPIMVDAFAMATQLALMAGFDGVELHAGNGFLIDQFLRDGSNQRTDAYGGAVEQRVRLLLDIVEASSQVWTPGRIGVRISPFNPYNDMQDSDPASTFTHVAKQLAHRGLAYLHVIEPLALQPIATSNESRTDAPLRLTPVLRAHFGGAVIANGGYTAKSAEVALQLREADAVAFGAPFIANPDLPQRLRLGLPLAQPDPTTYYGGDARGYTDYPAFAVAA
jgi:N-ethylmaleimide reductase